MTVRSYTPAELLRRVKALPEFLPISNRLAWSRDHESHRDHWLKWLEDYAAGIGYYGRKNHERDAAFIWSHLQSTGMLIYLAEAAGVSLETVKRIESMEGELRIRLDTLTKIKNALERAGIEFIAENGGGPGIRLRKKTKR